MPSKRTEDILAERGARYGAYADHARITQKFKRVAHNCPNWPKLKSDQKESIEMILHKLGRILNGDPDYDDSWDDMAGYSKLSADECRKRKA